MAILHNSVAITGCPYLPWIGFFYKLSLSEQYVVLDTVHIPRGRSVAYRNKIRLGEKEHWLSVPIRRVNKGFMRLVEVVIDNSQNWRRKHLMAIKHAYSKSPYFDEVFTLLEPVYLNEYDRLCELNLELIRRLGSFLGIERPILLASELGVETEDPTERLAELTARANGSAYIAGFSGPDYMSHAPFRKHNVKCYVYDFKHPEYRQMGDGFIPRLSILDLLFNEGPDAGEIVKKSGGEPWEFVDENES